MTRIMVVVGSVRPGRIGLPIAEWVRDTLSAHDGVEVDLVDLAEVALPLMDEPNHPRLQNYTHQHTLDWSERVDAADGFVFVTPEYNHSFSPALKNAIDFLHNEWFRKPVGFVSYGGISAGTRGVLALKPVLAAVGLVPASVAVEIPFAARQLDDEGQFQPIEAQERNLAAVADELVVLGSALESLQRRRVAEHAAA
ncbi:NADPH-dependent FMN reductase [Herbiconiux sp. P17]|uniref:NADPH-dependent FMN reductase n=1 Tax=Herbiconiux wuyangfengii TaxID=3342794 RepID=UPI0035BA336B